MLHAFLINYLILSTPVDVYVFFNMVETPRMNEKLLKSVKTELSPKSLMQILFLQIHTETSFTLRA